MLVGMRKKAARFHKGSNSVLIQDEANAVDLESNIFSYVFKNADIK